MVKITTYGNRAPGGQNSIKITLPVVQRPRFHPNKKISEKWMATPLDFAWESSWQTLMKLQSWGGSQILYKEVYDSTCGVVNAQT